MRSLLSLLALIPSIAWAGDACVSANDAKASHQGATIIGLTPDQWQFARGVFVLNPNTPPGLPFGDHAILATYGPRDWVIFVDDTQWCTPMEIPKTLKQMLIDIGLGKIPHEGTEN